MAGQLAAAHSPSQSSPVDVDDVDFVTTSIKNQRETEILIASGSKRGPCQWLGRLQQHTHNRDPVQ